MSDARPPAERTPSGAAGATLRSGPAFGVAEVRVSGFRSARAVTFRPGPLCALVGQASTGKSNLLEAMRAALDPESAPLREEDLAADGDGLSIEVTLADGGTAWLRGTPARAQAGTAGEAPPLLFLPAAARGGAVLAESRRAPTQADALFRRALARARSSPASQAGAVVEAVEACCSEGVTGVVLLLEEPELYLRPQAQRYLYRLLRTLSLAGNQVIYSTHSPAFLSVARLDELVFVERLPRLGTTATQPEPVTAHEDFRVMTELDAARSELFLARAAVLVEGWTEKLVLPFVFAAAGVDVDREAISIVECGGKPNLPLFARICRAAGVPFVVVHDSDRKSSGRFVAAERALNALIAESAGAEQVVVLDPDFEAAAGLTGDRRKPERAWREFAGRSAAEMPVELVRAVELTLALARPRG